MNRETIEALPSIEAAREMGYHAMYGPVSVEVRFERAPNPRPRDKVGAYLRGMYEGRRDWLKDLTWHDDFARTRSVVHVRDEERYLRVANLKATLPVTGAWASAEEVVRVLREVGVECCAVVASALGDRDDYDDGRAEASIHGGSGEATDT